MSNLPAFTLEIDADYDSTGYLVLGTSDMDSTEVLAADIRYVAVPQNDVLSVNIRRGRNRDDQANDVGTAAITLDAWSGDYDPDNDAGLYMFNGQRLLRQGMPLRVLVTVDSVEYVLFTGALEGSKGDYGRTPAMTWTAVDMLARLGNTANPPEEAIARTGDTSEERINWLLRFDRLYEDRTVTAGGRALIGTSGGGTLLSNLEDVARSEWGRVYADRDNTLVVTHHIDEYDKETTLVISDAADGTGEDEYGAVYADLYPGLTIVEPTDLEVDPGLTQVVNRAIVTRRAQGTPYNPESPDSDYDPNAVLEAVFTGEDDLSVERFGVRAMTVDTLLSSDGDAQALADYLAVRRSVPAPGLASVTAELAGLADGGYSAAAQVELGDWVRVDRTTPDGRAMTWLVSAEGIEHNITTTGWQLKLSTATLDLAAYNSDADWFDLDSSGLDLGDVLAPF